MLELAHVITNQLDRDTADHDDTQEANSPPNSPNNPDSPDATTNHGSQDGGESEGSNNPNSPNSPNNPRPSLSRRPVSVVFQPARGDDPNRRKPNITRAKQVLAWKPHVSLKQGLDHTIAYFKTELLLTTLGARTQGRSRGLETDQSADLAHDDVEIQETEVNVNVECNEDVHVIAQQSESRIAPKIWIDIPPGL